MSIYHKSQVDNLETQLAAANKRADALSTSVQELRAQNSSLKKQKIDLERQDHQRLHVIGSLEVQLNDADSIIDKARRENSSLQQSCIGFQSQARTLHNHLTEQKETISRLKDQSDLATSEIDRLREERSAYMAILPSPTKTEEECLRMLLSINQKVVELARQMTSEGAKTPESTPKNTRKENNLMMQNLLLFILWGVVFKPFAVGFTNKQNMAFSAIIAEIPLKREYG